MVQVFGDVCTCISKQQANSSLIITSHSSTKSSTNKNERGASTDKYLGMEPHVSDLSAYVACHSFIHHLPYADDPCFRSSGYSDSGEAVTGRLGPRSAAEAECGAAGYPAGY